jgi:hypothetical protein
MTKETNVTMDQTPTTEPTGPTTQPVVPVTPMTAVPAPSTRSKGGGWTNLVLVGALALAIGGVAFAVGRSTAPAAAASTNGLVPGAFGGPQGAGVPQGSFTPGEGGPNVVGPGFLGGGGLTIDGTVASVDGTSMTITLESGETVTVTLDDTTTYHSAVEASSEDVAVGDDVAVRSSGGGRFGLGPNASAAPSLTASDVTIVQ